VEKDLNLVCLISTFLTSSVCIPALLISGLNAYNLFKEHQAHLEHAQHDEEELKEYPYQNIRYVIYYTLLMPKGEEVFLGRW